MFHKHFCVNEHEMNNVTISRSMKLNRTTAVSKVDIILVNKNFLTRLNLKNKGLILFMYY